MTVIRTTRKLVRTTKTRRPTRFTKLTTADLRDDAKVLESYAATKTTPVSVYDAELFDVFAAAECALDHGDNPPALFAWLVHGRRWDMLTNAQDDVARQRVLKLRNHKRWAERETQRRRDDDSIEERREPVSLGDVLADIGLLKQYRN